MEFMEYSKRKKFEGVTTLYENSPIQVRAIRWVVQNTVEPVYRNGRLFGLLLSECGRNSKGFRVCDELPPDFCIREFIDYDFTDDDTLIAFVREYGFPVKMADILADRPWKIARRSSLSISAFSFSDEANREMREWAEYREKASYLNDRGESVDGVSGAVLRSAVSELQAAIINALEAVKSGELEQETEQGLRLIMNLSCRDSSFALSVWHPSDLGVFTAISNQFIGLVEAPVYWRKCARERCGRLFKYQIDNKDRFADTHRHGDAIYCSKQCADAATKWKQRHPEKSNPAQ